MSDRYGADFIIGSVIARKYRKKRKQCLLGLLLLWMVAFTACGKAATVDVELTKAGDLPITVVNAIQDVTGMEMTEAKSIVDGTPAIIVEDVTMEKAEEIKKVLEEAGATVTIQ